MRHAPIYPRGVGMGPARLVRNIHPTVKPLELMRWLTRLICPPDGTVLDPVLRQWFYRRGGAA